MPYMFQGRIVASRPTIQTQVAKATQTLNDTQLRNYIQDLTSQGYKATGENTYTLEKDGKKTTVKIDPTKMQTEKTDYTQGKTIETIKQGTDLAYYTKELAKVNDAIKKVPAKSRDTLIERAKELTELINIARKQGGSIEYTPGGWQQTNDTAIQKLIESYPTSGAFLKDYNIYGNKDGSLAIRDKRFIYNRDGQAIAYVDDNRKVTVPITSIKSDLSPYSTEMKLQGRPIQDRKTGKILGYSDPVKKVTWIANNGGKDEDYRYRNYINKDSYIYSTDTNNNKNESKKENATRKNWKDMTAKERLYSQLGIDEEEDIRMTYPDLERNYAWKIPNEALEWTKETIMWIPLIIGITIVVKELLIDS